MSSWPHWSGWNRVTTITPQTETSRIFIDNMNKKVAILLFLPILYDKRDEEVKDIAKGNNSITRRCRKFVRDFLILHWDHDRTFDIIFKYLASGFLIAALIVIPIAPTQAPLTIRTRGAICKSIHTGFINKLESSKKEKILCSQNLLQDANC